LLYKWGHIEKSGLFVDDLQTLVFVATDTLLSNDLLVRKPGNLFIPLKNKKPFIS
jgi:hypothetical protein